MESLNLSIEELSVSKYMGKCMRILQEHEFGTVAKSCSGLKSRGELNAELCGNPAW